MEIKKVKLNNKDVKKIYTDSFKKEERMPFSLMILLTKMTATDFLAFYDKDVLCGFVYTGTSKNITFVMFFAVDKDIRGKGYGSKILDEIKNIYPNNKIIVSFERTDVEAEDINDRIRRKKFYLKNGFIDTGYIMELAKIEQEICIRNGEFNEKELKRFFIRYSYGATNPKVWKR